LTNFKKRDLAEGWYDPSTKQKADQQAALNEREPIPERPIAVPAAEQDNDEDEVGPALPSHIGSASRFGPAIPNRNDLEYRDGTNIPWNKTESYIADTLP
jgi:hypothetical protein